MCFLLGGKAGTLLAAQPYQSKEYQLPYFPQHGLIKVDEVLYDSSAVEKPKDAPKSVRSHQIQSLEGILLL